MYCDRCDGLLKAKLYRGEQIMECTDCGHIQGSMDIKPEVEHIKSQSTVYEHSMKQCKFCPMEFANDKYFANTMEIHLAEEHAKFYEVMKAGISDLVEEYMTYEHPVASYALSLLTEEEDLVDAFEYTSHESLKVEIINRLQEQDNLRYLLDLAEEETIISSILNKINDESFLFSFLSETDNIKHKTIIISKINDQSKLKEFVLSSSEFKLQKQALFNIHEDEVLNDILTQSTKREIHELILNKLVDQNIILDYLDQEHPMAVETAVKCLKEVQEKTTDIQKMHILLHGTDKNITFRLTSDLNKAEILKVILNSKSIELKHKLVSSAITSDLTDDLLEEIEQLDSSLISILIKQSKNLPQLKYIAKNTQNIDTGIACVDQIEELDPFDMKKWRLFLITQAQLEDVRIQVAKLIQGEQQCVQLLHEEIPIPVKLVLATKLKSPGMLIKAFELNIPELRECLIARSDNEQMLLKYQKISQMTGEVPKSLQAKLQRYT
ncbi:MAG: hypothetical protein INQ03_16850 [Candidatus Heimdallarchaeota archaeon]|nr:hypothetical protein [Candidatus Heimdallarchaeota archaeon]